MFRVEAGKMSRSAIAIRVQGKSLPPLAQMSASRAKTDTPIATREQRPPTIKSAVTDLF